MKNDHSLLLTDNVILNGGDAAILKGTLDALACDTTIFPDNILIHCDYYDTAASRYPTLKLKRSLQETIRKFPPSFFWRFSAKNRFKKMGTLALSKEEKSCYLDYKSADTVITCGGSFLTDAYDLDSILLGYDLALDLGKPIIMLGQSIGPFTSEHKKSAVFERLKQFEKLVVRDRLSYETAIAMGCNANRVVEGRDMAFLIDTGSSPRLIDNDDLTIGISMRRWIYPDVPQDKREEHHKKYILSLASLIERLVDTYNANVVFISTCQGEPAYRFQDSAVAQEVISHLDEKLKARCTLIDEFQTPNTFVENLSSIDLFIGTRMHACILALISNIPTFNICYEFKSRELFDSMGLGEFVCDIDSIDPDYLMAKVDVLLGDYNNISKTIFDKVVEFRLTNQKIVSNLF